LATEDRQLVGRELVEGMHRFAQYG
ncbi:MAG: hypothetical protein QOF19_3292, partial [Alphaproteobacteria bacterium]|nr:hypothetical protein [Alphaproteobacteria bacterium]